MKAVKIQTINKKKKKTGRKKLRKFQHFTIFLCHIETKNKYIIYQQATLTNLNRKKSLIHKYNHIKEKQNQHHEVESMLKKNNKTKKKKRKMFSTR